MSLDNFLRKMSEANELAAALAAVAASGSLSLEELISAGIDPNDFAAANNDPDGVSHDPGPNSKKATEAFLEGAYQANPQTPLSNLERLSDLTGMNIADLQEWFYRRRLRDLSRTVEGLESLADAADHAEVTPAPAMLEDAQTLIGRTVIKYFEPVQALNYPGGNAAGTVADVQVQAFLPPPNPSSSATEELQHHLQAQPQFLFLIKYGESYEEYVLWDQLATILMPVQTPPLQGIPCSASQYLQDAGTTSDTAGYALLGADASGTMEGREMMDNQMEDSPSDSPHKKQDKRHRPFRYIQLPVGMAHELFSEGTFPIELDANMYIDDVFVHHIPGGSLVRCKHPRSKIGFQYQLYGVQDFRRAFSAKPIKINNIVKSENGRTIDVYFESLTKKDSAMKLGDSKGAGKSGGVGESNEPTVNNGMGVQDTMPAEATNVGRAAELQEQMQGFLVMSQGPTRTKKRGRPRKHSPAPYGFIEGSDPHVPAMNPLAMAILVLQQDQDRAEGSGFHDSRGISLMQQLQASMPHLSGLLSNPDADFESLLAHPEISAGLAAAAAAAGLTPPIEAPPGASSTSDATQVAATAAAALSAMFTSRGGGGFDARGSASASPQGMFVLDLGQGETTVTTGMPGQVHHAAGDIEAAAPPVATGTAAECPAHVSQDEGTMAQLSGVTPAAPTVTDPHCLGSKMKQVMELVTPVLGPSSSAACSDEAAELLKHLELVLDGVMEGQHAYSHSAWGLASHIAGALELLNQAAGLDMGPLPLSIELRAVVVDLLEQLAGALMMAGHSGAILAL